MNDQNYTPEVVDVVDAAPKLPMQENGKPLKRKQYLFSAASKKTRITSFIALGLAALFILLVVIGTISTLNADIWDIPLFGMVMDKKELKSLENQVEDAYDEIKDVIRSKDDEEIERLEDKFDTKIKSVEKAFKNPSLINMSTLFVGIGEKEAAQAGALLMGLVIFFAIFVLFFAGLGTLFLKKGLLITAYIFSIPFYLLFAGTALLVVATIVLIAYIVVQSMANADYKKYKMALKNQ